MGERISINSHSVCSYVTLLCMDKSYAIAHYLAIITTQLLPIYQDTLLCQQYAWWMLQALCDTTKTELLTQETLMLSPDQSKKLDSWLYELVHDKKPLQYILGSVPFADLDILVEPPMLIPRPETEEWCLYILEHLRVLDDKKLKILDIATGSGCIALAFAHHVPQIEVVATDISESALALAQKNSVHTKIRNVTLIKSDLFESIPLDLKFDLIVSNPPYITYDEFKMLDDTVTKWEDPQALVADQNGLAIIKKIIECAPQFIQTNDEMKRKNIPQVVIEIGYAQGSEVKTLMKNAHYNDILVHKDLEGKDRFVTGRVDYVANSFVKK